MADDAPIQTPEVEQAKPVETPAKVSPVEHANVYAALAAAVLHTQEVVKDKENKNERFGYRYASAEAIFRACRESLALHGLVFIPSPPRIRPSRKNERFFDPRSDAVVRLNFVMVRSYKLAHGASAEVLDLGVQEWPVVVEKGRPEDKAWAAADTASQRYMLRDLLSIPAVQDGTDMDGDDREDHASPSSRGRQQKGRGKKAPRSQPTTDDSRLPGLLAAAGQKSDEGGLKTIVATGERQLSAEALFRLKAYCRAVHNSLKGKKPDEGMPSDVLAAYAAAREAMAEAGARDRFGDLPSQTGTNAPPGPGDDDIATGDPEPEHLGWLRQRLTEAVEGVEVGDGAQTATEFMTEARGDFDPNEDPDKLTAFAILDTFVTVLAARRSRKAVPRVDEDAISFAVGTLAQLGCDDPWSVPEADDEEKEDPRAILLRALRETKTVEDIPAHRRGYIELLGGTNNWRFRALVTYGFIVGEIRKGVSRNDINLTTKQQGALKTIAEAFGSEDPWALPPARGIEDSDAAREQRREQCRVTEGRDDWDGDS